MFNYGGNQSVAKTTLNLSLGSPKISARTCQKYAGSHDDDPCSFSQTGVLKVDEFRLDRVVYVGYRLGFFTTEI